MALAVRRIEASDEREWRRLWAGYIRFYESTVDDETTTTTWRRLLDPGARVNGVCIDDGNGGLSGIANYILHDNTWEQLPVCYLQDLFVDPDARAHGVGRCLLDWLVGAMSREGWSRVYWLTREDNYRARGLYDHYTPRDAFVRYVVKAAR